ncbi:uncharacterized protein LOC123298918 [Chrysoperla carnea]|uniref:uncharacterized protein LOC123298918 n=1 Tax=Chrysoperla carnea TaxID=189513 RepID=UPI001D076DA2|nr:uncharacterized protein LOC123298918 [Chrysoperla carnea]
MTFFNPYKNSYLQLNSQCHGVNPRLINRAVNAAMGWETDSHDKEPPLNRLISNQATLPTTFNDAICRPQAFGKWALPKLIRELHSECPQTVSNAIDTIMDMVHYPEKAIEAIELRIVQRVMDLMQNPDASIRERICIILNTLGHQQIGREAICTSKLVLKSILDLLKDEVQVVRFRAAVLAQSLSDNFISVFALIDFDYITVIHQRILVENDVVLVRLLKTMKNLIQAEGKNIAYSIGVFHTMVLLLKRTQVEILEETLLCLMILLTLKIAKKEAVKIFLLDTLYKLLCDTRTEVYTAACGAVMNASHRTKAKKQSVEIVNMGLLDRLVVLMHDQFNPRAQMWSIRALTNLTEYPPNREYLQANHMKSIERLNIGCKDKTSYDNIAEYYRKLLNVINWKP